MSIDWPAFAEIVRENQRFLLTSHVRPDCDALGSELGLAGLLESLGKEVAIVNAHPTPQNLAFIDPRRRIRILGEGVTADELVTGFDVLIVLDTSAWAQLGPMAEVVRASDARKLVIDHHQGEDDLGAELFKERDAEATGRLIEDAARHLGVSLTREMAMPLFAALATDTGWFRFNSVTAQTYRSAARLMEAGAVPGEIFLQLYEQETLGRVRLWGRILTRLATEMEGRLIHTYVAAADYEECNALPTDTEDAINKALTVAGTEVALILVEQPGGGVKVSFRSRCAVDCSKLAASFGGGGHKAAAGAFLKTTLVDAKARVLDAARAAMR